MKYTEQEMRMFVERSKTSTVQSIIAAGEIIEQLLEERRWIPVEERLPEFDVPVLVCCHIYGRYISHYGRIGETDCGVWCDPDGRMGDLPPTHWKPLLEKP